MQTSQLSSKLLALLPPSKPRTERRIPASTRDACCPYCRRAVDIGDARFLGIYAHDSCAERIRIRMIEPLNVYEDLTAFVSVVLIAAIAVLYVIVPIGQALVAHRSTTTIERGDLP